MLRLTNLSDPGVNGVTPLVLLLDEAEPEPDLFARIEAHIDGEKKSRMPKVNKAVILALACGITFGALGMWGLQDRQRIAARPSAETGWIPLGSVTLHGAALRSFVKSKCHGHTHFYITMHGRSDKLDETGARQEILLMKEEEKILMDCIF